MTALELRCMEWADRWWTSSFLNQVIPWVTYLGSHYAVILFILLSWLLTRQRKILRYLFLLYGIQSGVLYGIKFLVQRQRPLFVLETVSKLPRESGEILDFSFPSGHAVYSFMMATLLSTWFPRYRIMFYLAAAFIGWTRVYLGVHFPTDVMVGSLLGYGITKLFLRWFPDHGFSPSKEKD